MKKRMLGVGLLGLMACSQGSGNVTFTTYGEDFIEKEIPAEDFEDGWTVKYSKFLVTLGELKVADHGGEVAAESAGAKVFDVHKPGPVTVVRFSALPAADWDEVSYAIAPSASAEAGNVSAADVNLLKANGWSVYMEGTATKGAVTKRFAWGFPSNTLYEHCEHPDLGEGLTVPNGGEETVQLTIHGDHLFFDDLQSPDAKMRFDALAAADKLGISGADGEVTLEELAQVDLTELPAGQYGTGGAANVRNLRDFVTALVRTVGHFRGEGECSPRVR
uniref:Lipoprotein n=1 Tax=Archangium gephyra TaxID=48 RepID=A0A3Q8I1G6_9BACT|nr:hypothetical protein [Archangium gephyra]